MYNLQKLGSRFIHLAFTLRLYKLYYFYNNTLSGWFEKQINKYISLYLSLFKKHYNI